jgi:hypothetical protein
MGITSKNSNQQDDIKDKMYPRERYDQLLRKRANLTERIV